METYNTGIFSDVQVYIGTMQHDISNSVSKVTLKSENLF